MKKHGFTLIELLVVISIIALLMAIIMPALRRAKGQAQKVACQSNLRQWSIVFKMYTDDYDGSFNEGWAGGALKSNWWMDAGRVYYGDVDEIRCCPTATRPRNAMDGSPGPGRGKEPFAAWGFQATFFKVETDYGSYGVNGWLEDKPAEWTTPERHRKFWRKSFTIKGAATVPVITDAQWIDGWPEPDDPPPPEENSYWNDGTLRSHMVRYVQNRHKSNQCMTFADGSVAVVGLKQLWTFKWHRYYSTAGSWTLAGGATPNRWPEWMRSLKDY